MTKFELLINGTDDLKGVTPIHCIINDLNKGGSFSADLVANNFSELVSKMPEGYEVDRLTTLCNYFNPVTVDKYEIELINSQFIYFAPFEVVQQKFTDYVNALESSNFAYTNKLDYIYRTK